MSAWVNADVGRMAGELADQAREVSDERDPHGSRRAALLRAAAHMLHAYAELLTLPLDPLTWSGVRPTNGPQGWCPACGATARGPDTLHAADCALKNAPNETPGACRGHEGSPS